MAFHWAQQTSRENMRCSVVIEGTLSWLRSIRTLATEGQESKHDQDMKRG
jgi:hypothetical protein